jgi:hypothetical protein
LINFIQRDIIRENVKKSKVKVLATLALAVLPAYAWTASGGSSNTAWTASANISQSRASGGINAANANNCRAKVTTYLDSAGAREAGSAVTKDSGNVSPTASVSNTPKRGRVFLDAVYTFYVNGSQVRAVTLYA